MIRSGGMDLGQHCSRNGLRSRAPSHYLNKCWRINNRTIGNKLHKMSVKTVGRFVSTSVCWYFIYQLGLASCYLEIVILVWDNDTNSDVWGYRNDNKKVLSYMFRYFFKPATLIYYMTLSLKDKPCLYNNINTRWRTYVLKKRFITGSCNGLTPSRCQAINYPNQQVPPTRLTIPRGQISNHQFVPWVGGTKPISFVPLFSDFFSALSKYTLAVEHHVYIW